MADEDKLGFLHDHATIAWSHFLAQHENKPYTEAFVTAFYPPLVELDTTQNELYTKRWIDTAEGVQLDGVGSIVGKSREVPNSVYLPFFGFISQPAGRAFGTYRMRFDRDPYATSGFLGDTEYRKAIYTKIADNNSHGTAEDIMRIVNDVIGVTKTAIFDMGNANAALMINDMTITYADYRADIIDEIIPRAGGVQIFPYLFDLTKTFGFSNQLIYFGFGVGILARMINSNIPPITIVSAPSLSLDFMVPGTFPVGAPFTRAAGPATYFDINGVMQTTTTINQPRWDYDPVTHELKGVMIEEARTNKLFPSVPATGHYLSSVTRIPNSGIAPDGTNTFVKMANTTSNTFHGMQFVATAALGNTQYTASCFIKRGEFRYVQFILDDQGGGTPASICTFDLQNGVISSGSAINSIVNVGNGIYRCTLIMTATGASTTSVRLGINNANISNPSFYVPAYVGVEGEGTYIWGVQIEQGAVVTSYIPTTTAVATRSVEICNITPLGSWFNADEGSLLIEFIARKAAYVPGGFSNGTFGNTLYFSQAGNGMTAILDTVGKSAGSSVVGYNIVQKMGCTYQSNRLTASNNGGVVGVNNTAFLGPFKWTSNLAIGVSPWGVTGGNMCGHIRKVQYWKNVLTSADLRTLTTLTGAEMLPYEPDIAQPRQEQV